MIKLYIFISIDFIKSPNSINTKSKNNVNNDLIEILIKFYL